MSTRNFIGALARSLLLTAACGSPAIAREVNWTVPNQPCLNAAELRKAGHMNIGVRFDLRDPIVISQFHRALQFWESMLDARFYDDGTSECTIAVVPATRAILGNNLTIARTQLPDRLNFNGLIAIDPAVGKRLPDDEAIATWIHEIGHILGLKHNPDPFSLMYYLDVDSSSKLDEADLSALASLHAMRSTPLQLLREQASVQPLVTHSRQRVIANN